MDNNSNKLDTQRVFIDQAPPKQSKRAVTYWIASLLLAQSSNPTDLLN